MTSVLTMEDLSSILRDSSPGLGVAVAERVFGDGPVVIVIFRFGIGLLSDVERTVAIGGLDIYE